jgi:LacI family transcriptional regulator
LYKTTRTPETMASSQRIALLLPQDIGYGRAVLRGVQEYAVAKPHWIFRDAPPTLDALKPLREWKPHGIIALLFDHDLANALIRMRKPVVNTTSTLDLPKMPLVENDHQAIGRMAAEYFLQRGFRNFGFFGSNSAGSSKVREASFRSSVDAAGYCVSSCYAEYLPRAAIGTSWAKVDRRIDAWLKSRSTPIAILTQNDVPARDLAYRCRDLGLNIPHDVSLMGVDNDELECHLCYPPLTSIAVPGRRIGIEAAQVLDRMMRGQQPKQLHQFLPPLRIVARQSTDTLAVEDELVASALRLIHDRATGQLTVSDIERHTGTSRRQIERRFRQQLNTSPLEEIRRVRIERAKQLLVETDLGMPQIASTAGFNDARRLSVVFKEQTGQSPSAFRKTLQNRIGSD